MSHIQQFKEHLSSYKMESLEKHKDEQLQEVVVEDDKDEDVFGLINKGTKLCYQMN